MSRKWISVGILIVLAGLLAGCAARKQSTLVSTSPTFAPAQTTPLETQAPLPASQTPVPPEPTSIPQSPTPLPATQTPLPAPSATGTPIPTPSAIELPAQPPTPALSGPAISHIQAGKPVTVAWIHMIDAEHGWAFGGPEQGSDHVLTTADGGQTWRDVTPPEPATTDTGLVAIGYFANAEIAWVTYHSQNDFQFPTVPIVWRTLDGGKNWQASSPLDLQGLNELYYPSDLAFADAQDGWLLIHVGAGMNHDYVALYRTKDGGQTWVRVLDPYNDGGIQVCQKTGIIFRTPENGWLTGDCNGVMAGAFLYETTDSGLTWQPVVLPAPVDTPDLFSDTSTAYCGTLSPLFFSPQAGKLVLRCVDTVKSPPVNIYYLYSTSDGGTTWTSVSIPSGTVDFLDADKGWVLSRNIFFTSDDGKNWSFVKGVNWDGQFSFVSEQLGWAVARAENDTKTMYALVQTTDGGKTWSEIHPTIAP